MTDPLTDELEGPFHPEKWGAVKMCGNCEFMQSDPPLCLACGLLTDPTFVCMHYIPGGDQ